MHDFENEYPAVSPHGTALARHLAGILDNVFAGILALIAAKQVDEENIYLQGVVAVGVYLSYYFVFEVLTSRSVGKLVTGLKVIDFDGKKCTTKQVAIRTAFRLLEVNPFLLGALPAAVQILFTPTKQRMGDRVARTVVVFSRRC